MKNNRAGRIFNLSRRLYLKNVPILPKCLWMINRVVFSCDIPYETDIDASVYFSHNGLGTVVNKNCKIGKDTLILQHVTLGGNMGKKKMIDNILTSAPVIGNGVICGVGSKILGPVKIGDNVKIGAGAVVLTDIPANSVAVGIPAKIINSSGKNVNL